MLDYFDKKKVDYYCLFHTDDMDLNRFINGVTTYTNAAASIPNFIRHCLPGEQQEICKYCIEHREEFHMTSSQHIMLAIVWILPQEKRLFSISCPVL